MSKIDYQALRELAKQATQGEWVAFISPGKYGTYAVHTPGDNHHGDIVDWPGFDEQKNAENNARYIAAFNPEVVQALLDERERNQQYIKRRDQENEDIALTVGKLRVELEAAENNLIDSECHVAELEEALRDKQALLEASEKRIAELESGSQAQKLVEAIIVAIENEQERLFDEDYLMDSKECIDVIREEVKRWNDSRAAGIRIKGE
ncbi:ead/Ea22-like family protein [Escherichia coli]|nr:ead/Ea22-like family protein [Escherichia coli]